MEDEETKMEMLNTLSNNPFTHGSISMADCGREWVFEVIQVHSKQISSPHSSAVINSLSQFDIASETQHLLICVWVFH